MLEAKLDFVGCSCGCTPWESVTIRAETQEDLDKACVKWALDFRVHGDRPFRKVRGIPESASALCVDVITVLGEIDDLTSQRKRSERDRDGILSGVRRIEDAAKTLEIDIPEGAKERVAVMMREAVPHEEAISQLDGRIAEAKDRFEGLLRTEHPTEIIGEYDDDDDD